MSDSTRRKSGAQASPIVTFERVSKRFGATVAVDDLSLQIGEGEFFALLGPSGCGKTTLLRMLAGFETPSEGRILIDGQDVAAALPNKRPVNMVFQSYAVFPHMKVADNVAYGLKMERVPDAERRRRVGEALDLVQLQELAERMPDQLSGGQRQRVALARALVKRPRVLLLDEPLSALDAKLRDQMRAELTALQQRVGITFIMVTHDQAEALAIASRCAVMNRGKVAQVATPSDLYEFPNSRFVADFVGSVNLFEAVVERSDATGARLRCRELSAPVHLDRPVAAAPGATVWLALRPEKIEMFKAAPVLDEAQTGANAVSGVIRDIVYLGSVTNYQVELEGGRRVKTSHSNLAREGGEGFAAGQPVWLAWRASAPVVLLS